MIEYNFKTFKGLIDDSKKIILSDKKLKSRDQRRESFIDSYKKILSLIMFDESDDILIKQSTEINEYARNIYYSL